MKTFLQLTAEDLYHDFADRLPEITVVFPNNRAKLFFSKHLFNCAEKPIWTPNFLSIQDLYSKQSVLKKADNLSLITRLYRSYLHVSQKDESFDDFYLWGELLLSDFDDIDKNLADAKQLFRNIQDQARYTDTLEHLSEEQVTAIRQFFKNFDPNRKTELKQRFIEHWNILWDVYQDFREGLLAEGLAYEGMLHRHVIEHFMQQGIDVLNQHCYAFVGFNVLNQCEHRLFHLLHQSGKARFYWDYDQSYLSGTHEAGRFMRQNLTDFPNRLAASNFQILHSHHKDIHFLAAPTENTSARYVTQWLESLKKQDSTLRWEEVAVVLCNESLLLPVLHSIPSVVSAINVTMGFPLMQTPISTLLVRICQLKSSETARSVKPKWQRKRVLPILQHPIVQACSPKAKQVEQDLLQNNIFFPGLEQLNKDALLQWIFRPAKNSIELATQLREILTLFSKEEMSEHQAFQSEPLFQESIFQCYLTTTTLLDILQAEMVEVDLNIFAGLLQKMMSITSIPFSGEPIQGLQIMGMLETRNLDFKHILMLSVNEGMLPKKGQDVSFIPYNLKKGFGLTTREHKDSIYAYYFMRIIQRASHLSLAYNTSTDGINPGEMSRFMLQLLVDNPNTIHRHQLSSQIGLSGPRNICIPKTNAHLRSIKKLSPSALNTYIDCSLKFYFRYIAGLKPLDQAKEDIDGATLGTVFHHAAQHIYTDLLLRKKGLNPSPSEVESSINHELNGTIMPDDLDPWIKGMRSMEQVVDLALQRHFFKVDSPQLLPTEYSGEQLIKRRLLLEFLKALLKWDAKQAPFDVLGMEKEFSCALDVRVSKETYSIRIGGIVDRLDRKQDRFVLIDYKTGTKKAASNDLLQLFESGAKRDSHLLQLLIYSWILHQQQPDKGITPQLRYVSLMGNDTYRPEVSLGQRKEKAQIDDYRLFHKDFESHLKQFLSQLFDLDEAFQQTSETDLCTYCDFKSICRR